MRTINANLAYGDVGETYSFIRDPRVMPNDCLHHDMPVVDCNPTAVGEGRALAGLYRRLLNVKRT